MSLSAIFTSRLHDALRGLCAGSDISPGELAELAAMVRPTEDPRFGDYQANCAMPLAKRLAKPPREVAASLAARLNSDDMCEPVEVAGPGFINLKLKDSWLANHLAAACSDDRLGVPRTTTPRTFVIDYSSPNVAKPMHVGHIRSTVIGDALCRTLRFLGHRVISDNHLGDWGTQFGMILYGFKQFRDDAAYRSQPVHELARLYQLVTKLAGAEEAREQIPELARRIEQARAELAAARAAPQTDKKAARERRRLEESLAGLARDLDDARAAVKAVEGDPALASLSAVHPQIGEAARRETARLHEGDPENLALWQEFMPACSQELNEIYRRLDVSFDCTLGESFYRDRLAGVVADLEARGLARESDGATCVFYAPDAPPMLVRKKDGAYLYATTDLATIQYRVETWRPDAILYVVDHRQSLNFVQLFAVARLWGFDRVELTHVSFGTVLGEDGRPFKARSGDAVGLSGLLDEAVRRAYEVVCANDRLPGQGASLPDDKRRAIAEAIGIASVKYADLSQNRTSDYVFSYDKMVATNGNTAAYMQYAYARVRSIFRRGEVSLDALRAAPPGLVLATPAERALALALVRFADALENVVADYRPNQLTSYLWDLANRYSTFFESCPVLKAESPELRHSRLLLCDLTARTIQEGLALLGIRVVEQM